MSKKSRKKVVYQQGHHGEKNVFCQIEKIVINTKFCNLPDNTCCDSCSHKNICKFYLSFAKIQAEKQLFWMFPPAESKLSGKVLSKILKRNVTNGRFEKTSAGRVK